MCEPQTRTKHEEIALIAHAQAGDQNACEVLFSRFAPILRRGIPQLRNQEDREDLAQAILAKALKSIKGYDPGKNHGNFLTWLFGIARHEVADYWKDPEKWRIVAVGGSSAEVEDDAAGEDFPDINQLLPPAILLSVEAWEELLAVAFSRPSPPHHDLTYGFAGLLEWKPAEFDEICQPWPEKDEDGNRIPPPKWEPRKAGEKLSEFPLQNLNECFIEGYQRLSEIPVSELRSLLRDLSDKLTRQVKEVLPPNARSEYANRPRLLNSVAGESSLNEYYTRASSAQNITDWAYKAQKAIFEAIIDKQAGILYEVLSESHYYRRFLVARALKAAVVQHLEGQGFCGRFPNFHRLNVGWLEWLCIEFDDRTPRFRLLVAAEHNVNAAVISGGREPGMLKSGTPEYPDILDFFMLSRRGKVVSREQSTREDWFYFPPSDGVSETASESLAQEVLALLPYNSTWWGPPRSKHLMCQALEKYLVLPLKEKEFIGQFPTFCRLGAQGQEWLYFNFEGLQRFRILVAVDRRIDVPSLNVKWNRTSEQSLARKRMPEAPTMANFFALSKSGEVLRLNQCAGQEWFPFPTFGDGGDAHYDGIAKEAFGLLQAASDWHERQWARA